MSVDTARILKDARTMDSAGRAALIGDLQQAIRLNTASAEIVGRNNERLTSAAESERIEMFRDTRLAALKHETDATLLEIESDNAALQAAITRVEMMNIDDTALSSEAAERGYDMELKTNES